MSRDKAPAPEGCESRSLFAKRLNCRPSYVTELIKTDRVKLTPDGQFIDIAQSLARIQDTRDPSKAGVVERHAATRAAESAPPPPSDPAGDESEDDAIAADSSDARRRAKALADKAEWDARTAEREFLRENGKLYDAADVDRVWASAYTTLRTRLEQLAPILAPQVVSVAPDEAKARAIIDEEIQQALKELARQWTEHAKETAA